MPPRLSEVDAARVADLLPEELRDGDPRDAIFFEKMIIDFMLIYIDRTGNLDLALGWAGSR
jgi:hypothetical protein